MVREGENPSSLEAACCRVEVMNGGGGLRTTSFSSRETIRNSAPDNSSRIRFTLSGSVSFPLSLAVKGGSVAKPTSISQ